MLAAVFAGSYYAFSYATPRYQATAVVALEDREGEVIDMESVIGGLSSDQSTINTEMEVMRSRRLIGKLVQSLDLAADPEFNGWLRPVEPWSVGGVKRMILGPSTYEPTEEEIFVSTVDRVLGAVRVTNLRDSYVFNIIVETTSPQKSARIANTLAELYIGDQLELKFEATEKATKWLGQQVVSLKAELEEAERELKDFTAATEIRIDAVSSPGQSGSIPLVSSESLSVLGVQLKDLRDRLATARAASEEAAARVAALEEALETGTPARIAEVAGDEALDRMLTRLEDGTGTRELFDQRVSRLIERARLEQTRDDRQTGVLQRSIAELEERIERQSSELVKLQQLGREVEATALIYESFLTRLKELSVQQGLQEADARVLSSAVTRTNPSSPRKSLVLALSCMLGLVAGSGMVLVRERMQNVFRTADELERATDLPVLGQIPKAPTGRRQKLLDHVINKPTSAFSEAVRNMRTSILLSDVDRPPKVIMLTSSVPGEGKTTQSLSLAQNLALMGKKVLVIEGDIRRRTFSEYFDVAEDEVGLVSAVAGRRPLSEIVMRNESLGMDILLGEKSSVNAADFFSSKAFADFLRTAKEAYDVILLDTPPVLAVPDARVIGQLADAIIYVVQWDKTPKAQVASGLRAFQTLNLHITGLVLSQVDPKGMKRYGHESSYGYSGYYDT